jgi:uncharacterized protein (UPF0303 family)
MKLEYPTNAEIFAQEEALRLSPEDFDPLDFSIWLIKELRKRNETLCCMIRLYGSTVFQISLSGTHSINDHWLIRKSRVVELFGHSSLFVKQLHEENELPYSFYAINQFDYAFFGGSIPLADKNARVFGVLSISGTNDLSEHELAVDLLKSYLKK